MTIDKRQARALRESTASPMRFNTGDLVLLPAAGNMANPLRHSKVMCHWQGPYQVVAPVSEVEYVVRLLGADNDAADANVYWRRMRHLAGPGLAITKELEEAAQHDKQKFLVEHFEDWSVNTDGEVNL